MKKVDACLRCNNGMGGFPKGDVNLLTSVYIHWPGPTAGTIENENASYHWGFTCVESWIYLDSNSHNHAFLKKRRRRRRRKKKKILVDREDSLRFKCRRYRSKINCYRWNEYCMSPRVPVGVGYKWVIFCFIFATVFLYSICPISTWNYIFFGLGAKKKVRRAKIQNGPPFSLEKSHFRP